MEYRELTVEVDTETDDEKLELLTELVERAELLPTPNIHKLIEVAKRINALDSVSREAALTSLDILARGGTPQEAEKATNAILSAAGRVPIYTT